MIKKFLNEPINFHYKYPNKEDINWLKHQSSIFPVNQNSRIIPLHSYKNIKLKGAMDIMYTRKAIVLKLNEILALLPNEYSFLIFDAFRSKETQLSLFNYVYDQQKKIKPNLSHSELFSITKEFIVHPDDKSSFPIPPHNSGGAIDLTLALNGTALDMGTEFDEVTELSYTDWFEQEFKPEFGISKERWFKIRDNRRLLFNLMKDVGFINYKVEWWHYDLGDCMWAKEHQLNWYFPSLENEL